MPSLSLQDFQAGMRSGKIGPLYLLIGEETFLKENALNTLIDAALEPTARPFNLDVFRGGEAPPGDIADRMLSFPLVAVRRVVVVKECDQLNEGAARVLLPLLESPPETTTAVFVGDKVDGRKRFFALLQKTACVVTFKPMKGHERLIWVQERLRASGKRVSQEALHLFCERTAADLGILAGEIDKLLSFVGDRQAIEREDVERVVGVSAEGSIFDLTDAVGARDAGRALYALKRIREAGERSGGILWQLTQHVHRLMKVKTLKDSKVSDKDLPGKLALPPYVVTKYVSQARNFSYPDLWRAYETLVTAEDHLKSGYQTEETVLQLLVGRLCQ